MLEKKIVILLGRFLLNALRLPVHLMKIIQLVLELHSHKDLTLMIL